MSFPEKISDELIKSIKGQYGLLAWQVAKKASSAFAGGTTNAHGDYDGTLGTYTLFKVTGDVAILAVIGICNTDLTGGSATVEVGVAGNTAALIAQTTATDIDDGDVWNGATPAVGVGAVAGSGALYMVNDGADIIETAGSANVTAGQIDYYVIWAPLEDGAAVEAA